MQRRGNASGGDRETVLHHPAPQHPLNPRNLHSSPPPGMQALAGADYQRFSSPPVAPAADYQRFTSPPVQALGGGAAAGGLTGGQQHGPGGGVSPSGMYAASQTSAASSSRGQLQSGPSSRQPPGGGGGYPGQQQHAMGVPGQHAPWDQFANGNMFNDATAQMGMQFGRSAVAAGQEYVNKNFMRHLPVAHLLHSFNVSNKYVLLKLRLVLFPWRHRPWSRLVKRNETSGQIEGYKPPRDDINSPDMYIPLMALVTYILLAGVVTGTRGEFHPDDLGLTASRSLGVIFIEFCLIKLGTYLLNIGGEGTVVDLFSYSSYKFVGIIVTLLVQLLSVRGWLYWAIFVYVFCANAFFLLRSLRYVVLPDPSLQGAFADTNNATPTSGVTHAQRSRRIKFLFFIAVSQIGSMWYLIRV